MPANNLPAQPTPFVGREKELADIAALLADPKCRLLTLVGPGGIGKTRLAIQAALSQQPHFIDGVSFVSFAPVGSPDLIPSAIAGALDITFFGAEEPRIQLAHYLGEKHLLLVMDNVEHLLEGIGLLTELLQAAPSLKILTTSRERLNLQEEWGFPLDGLTYPTETDGDSPENYTAVELFVQRARQINIHFSLSENAQAVRSICRQVEGMPLGLELAASWLRGMSCQQIVTQMTSNLDFLTTPLRNVPERHRSLRLVFDQSWRFLSSAEQAVLMKLSVFRGGFDLQAAEQVAGASLPILAGLADKSLIRLNAIGRYDLHELLHQYAADQLLNAGLTTTTTQQHIDYFLKFAEQAEAHLFGREQIVWFDRLEVEFDNLRAALTRSAASETGLRLAAALGWFFAERTHWREGLDWLEQMLAANPDIPSSLRRKALHRAGHLAGMLGDYPRSQALNGQALAQSRTTNDRWNTAWALTHLAFYPQNHPVEHSAALLEESLALFRELEDPMGMTHTLLRLSTSAFVQRNYPYVRQLLEEASIHAEQFGDHIMIAWITFSIGMLHEFQDDNLQQAGIITERSLLLFREARFQIGIYNALVQLARIERKMGNMMQSQVRTKLVLAASYNTLRDNNWLPHLFVELASIATASGELKQTATLLGAANSIIVDGKHDPAFYPELENAVVSLRINLGEKVFAEAWATGEAMTREQAIAYALEDSASHTEIPPSVHTSSQPLTERELEILRLMTDGLNSREVAERLVLSVETVRWYLKQIYSKLNVHGRSEAIARAKELKLLT